jgi:hypothetical protein
MRRLLLLSPLLFVVACSAETTDTGEPSTDTTESAATSVRWEPVFRCDDGTVLDVNASERREVQFVIRNKDAIWWMQHSIECQWNEASCPTNAAGEMVFRGRVDRGVFYQRDFDKVLASLTPASPSWTVAGLVDREPGDTIKLQIGEYYNWIFRGCR